MAASLAAAELAGMAEVSSAGVEAWGQPASPKTIALMRRKHGIDLSSHRSRDIEDLKLAHFDYILAMKPEYAKRLTRYFRVPTEKIAIWDVDDPFIEGTDVAYETCLAQIERLLTGFLKGIRSKQRSDRH